MSASSHLVHVHFHAQSCEAWLEPSCYTLLSSCAVYTPYRKDCRTNSITASSNRSFCKLCAQPMQTTGVSCQIQPKHIMYHALPISGVTVSYGVAGSCKASWLRLMVMPRYDVRLCSPVRSVCHHDMMMLRCCSGCWNRPAATHSCCIICSQEPSFSPKKYTIV